MNTRSLQHRIPGLRARDGAGVYLLRSLGQSQGTRLDPFLMLDEFSSENPDDYIAGFPPHPHRGFETVTYMLAGHMRHEDHLGNRGELRSGGAQWMTAGRGIIHSEMPQQQSGRMHGFQLWINLPAREKMKPAAYRDIQPEEIPEVVLHEGGRARLIAGRLQNGEQTVAGPIQGLSTEPLFIDLQLPPGATFTQAIDTGHAAFIYGYDGEVEVLGSKRRDRLEAHVVGVLGGGGDFVQLRAGDGGAGLLLLAAKPLREPIAQRGPFVMNTAEEIEQALADYRDGTLTSGVTAQA